MIQNQIMSQETHSHSICIDTQSNLFPGYFVNQYLYIFLNNESFHQQTSSISIPNKLLFVEWKLEAQEFEGIKLR